MTDTIVALSSGALPSGVAVIRLSGPATRDIAQRPWPAPCPSRAASRSRPSASAAKLLDHGLVAWFPAPHSFTGEDCAELQVHGSPAVVRAILARPSRPRRCPPGRSRRVHPPRLRERQARSHRSRRPRRPHRRRDRERSGSRPSRASPAASPTQVDGWRETLLDLRAEIEARLDFSDEGDVGELPADVSRRDRRACATSSRQRCESVGRGRIVREGFRVALAGPPNAGKSSLLNALARPTSPSSPTSPARPATSGRCRSTSAASWSSSSTWPACARPTARPRPRACGGRASEIEQRRPGALADGSGRARYRARRWRSAVLAGRHQGRSRQLAEAPTMSLSAQTGDGHRQTLLAVA